MASTGIIPQKPSKVYSAHIGHTGIANGSGCLSINGDDTKFDISDGFGYVLDLTSDPEKPTVTRVNWSGLIALTPTYLLTNNISFIGIDSSGTVIQQTNDFTESQRRSIIVLGVLNHIGSVIASTTDDATTTDSYLANDLSHALGNINIEGNNFNAASTDLTIRKEAGISFIVSGNRCNDPTNPNRVTAGVEDGVSFLYIYDNGSGGVTAVPSTQIDPNHYDDGSGTLAIISGSNKWTNQHCYYFPSPNLVLVRYGNEVFNTETGATNAAGEIPPVIGTGVNPDLVRTTISVIKDATDLSVAGDAVFTDTGRFGLSGGAAGGSGSSGTLQDLQDVYNHSVTPEIVTDDTRGALSLKRGSATDSDNMLEVLNSVDTKVFTVTAEGKVTHGAVISPPTTSAAGNYTVLVSDYIIHKTGITVGGDTVTLPSTAANGQIFIIKDTSGEASVNNITVDTSGSETIDGSTTVIINGNYNGIAVHFDGVNYSILSSI